MIQVTDLEFAYSDKPLYKKVNFIVGKGQKIGLVGPNGSGKSTFLGILMAKEDGYKGKVKTIGSLALVPQEIKYDEIMESANSVRDYIDPENKHEDYELQKFLSGLQIDIDLDSSPKNKSGGQKTKMALARALLSNPDILLLDEPTNFMDLAGKHWVMDFLAKYKGTVIVISHDLNLMDSSIDKILAITPYNSEITEYKGSYSDYLRLKAQKEENLRKERTIKERHLKRMEEGYLKMDQYDAKKSIRRRKIEREKEALPDLPPEMKKISVRLPEPAKISELVIKVNGLSKSYSAQQVLKDVNFSLLRGERAALIGPNGVGKSTFIKILMGMIEKDSGEVFKSDQIKVGYYSQEFETFDFQKTVISAFTEATEKDENFARGFLGRYMFLGDKAFQRVETLSGGEKTRLAIAILTGRDNNLLILDEPTTYLDVMSQKVILESLKEYKGSMILVSHTPEFIKELKPTKALLFPEQKMVIWEDELADRVEEV